MTIMPRGSHANHLCFSLFHALMDSAAVDREGEGGREWERAVYGPEHESHVARKRLDTPPSGRRGEEREREG